MVDGDLQAEASVESGEQASPDAEANARDLLDRAKNLIQIAPNSYEAWRVQAELLVTAIRRLEKREMAPDPNLRLFGVPIAEQALRDAAEQALRHCAHFANTFDDKISLIDEANSVRRKTWF